MEEVLNILAKGKPDNVKTDDVQETIDILIVCARNDPEYLLGSIQNVVEVRIDGMVSLALAILTSCAPDDFFTQYTRGAISGILNFYTPIQLLEYVEFMRSKFFGRGFGSRAQKIVRMALESWDIASLKNTSKHAEEFKTLLRLVHPRFCGNRGKIVAEILR